MQSFQSWQPLLPMHTPIPPEMIPNFTPFRRSQKLGPLLGLAQLYWKDETFSPSGSFKWRQALIGVMEILRRKQKVLTVASTGNMALSFSKAATMSGIVCFSFIPSFTPPEKVILIRAYGGVPIKIDGSIDRSRRFIDEIEGDLGWAPANTTLRPFLLEACKTTAYEICRQLGWILPQKLFVSTGSGLHLAGIAKGIQEFIRLGLVEGEVVQFFAVQSNECCPYSEEEFSSSKRLPLHPFASALFVLEPPEKDLVKRMITDSGGAGLRVSKKEIMEAQALLAQKEGLFVEPSGAASLAGIIQMARKGLLDAEEVIVCVLTGTGYHDPKTARRLFQGAVSIQPTVDDFRKKVLENGDALAGPRI